jgi:uncharacterized phage protein (TIGR02218 family)
VIPFSPAMKQAVGREATTLCHCWLIERRDGITLGFTDHDQELLIGATPCRPLSGLNGSEVEWSLGLSINSEEIEGAISASEISDDDLASGAFDRALVRLHLADWTMPQHAVLLRTSRIGRVLRLDGVWRAEIESAVAELDVVQGRLFTRGCDALLGDARCKVPLASAAFTADGQVSAARPMEIDAAGLGGYAAGLFAGGTLQWTSGANAGRTTAVARHVRTAMTATLAFDVVLPHPVAAGDGFSVSAGCDKSFGTCKATFSNAMNFQGFPHMPGNDQVYGQAREGMNFDGGPVVP